MNDNTAIENIDSIAIIGMAVRMPGAMNAQQFWENLKTGTESISVFSKEEMLEAGLSPETVNHPNFVAAKGIMDEAELFDANFFGISPREAELMDPQHRVLMECAWAAMEDAGYVPENYPGNIAIFTSAGMNTYLPFNLMSNPHLLEQVGGFELSIYNDKDFVPTRIAYSMNIKGPAIDIGTACSSSLVSTHLACQHLITYQSDMTIVGGITIHLPQKMGHTHEPGAAYSPDSHCRPFDATPSGLIDGNGAAVIILKRLEDALRDGDKIHAIIKGSAINNDGSDKVGYSAPSVNGQAEVILEAQAAAGIDSSSIQYIEAHGTSTPLGDPIEMAGLTQAFRVSTDQIGFCGIGSVKSNIGHVDKAAGLAGLVKTTLALENELIPPSLNWQKPNPTLQIEKTPFYVVDKPTSWKRSSTPRRAGISSFGVGGTNAHAILEEAPIVKSSPSPRADQIITLSAKTRPILEAYAKNLAKHLSSNPSLSLADVASTLARGRKVFPHKLAITCSSIEAAMTDLQNYKFFEEKNIPNPIFMFTGQGSQYAGMAKELYQEEIIFKNAIDECADFLKKEFDHDIRKILFPAPADFEKSNQLLQETSITQPCLFSVEYAIAKLFIFWGIKPKAMIGHSLGEYVAATIAGVFSLSDALLLVVKRSQLMQSMDSGSMLSVSLSVAAVMEDLRELNIPLDIAAENAPELSVVSGSKSDVNKYQSILESRGTACSLLKTSHAFHSRMMEPMLSSFENFLKTISLHSPAIPLISNLTGAWLSDQECKSPEYWSKHLRKTVLFSQGIKRLNTEIQNPLYIEIGPGRTLSQLTQFNLNINLSSSHIIASLPQATEKKSASKFLLENLAKIWLKNQEINWDAFYANENRLKLSLPTYPFERTRYWIEPGKPQNKSQTKDAHLEARQVDPNLWFYTNTWKSIASLPSSNQDQSSYLIFTQSDLAANPIQSQLISLGHSVTTVCPGSEFLEDDSRNYYADFNNIDHLHQLSTSLQKKGVNFQSIVFIAPKIDEAFNASSSLLNIIKVFGIASASSKLQLKVICSGIFNIFGESNLVPSTATLLGLMKTFRYEFPLMKCALLDIDLKLLSLEAIHPKLMEWICSPNLNLLLALRANQFWMETIEPIDLAALKSESLLKKNASYFILGGLDGIGYAFAKTIAENVQCNLILSSADINFLSNSDITQKINTLEKMGSTIFSMYLDPIELMPGINRASTFASGGITGIINSHDMSTHKPMGLIQDTNQLNIAEYLTSQQSTLEQLRSFVDSAKPSFCIMMSSLSSKIGGIGQGIDAMAGNLINSFVQLQNVNSSTPWAVLNWDRWEENKYAQLSGFTPEEGSVAFHKALGLLRLETIIIASNNPQYRMESAVLKALGSSQENDTDENLYSRPDIDVEFSEPVTPNELALAKLWQNCLKINEIGVRDNFFDLGGHSLLAAQLIREIKQHFGINLDLGMFFSAPTIGELTKVIEEQLSTNQTQSIEAELNQIENMTEKEIEELLAGNHSPEELLNLLGKS